MRTTVLLCPRRMLLFDLVQSMLEEAEDVELVHVADVRMLAETARSRGASVAICIGPLPDEVALEALVARPRLRIIELAPQGSSASVLELVPSRRVLGELSRDLLLTEIGRSPPGA